MKNALFLTLLALSSVAAWTATSQATGLATYSWPLDGLDGCNKETNDLQVRSTVTLNTNGPATGYARFSAAQVMIYNVVKSNQIIYNFRLLLRLCRKPLYTQSKTHLRGSRRNEYRKKMDFHKPIVDWHMQANAALAYSVTLTCNLLRPLQAPTEFQISNVAHPNWDASTTSCSDQPAAGAAFLTVDIPIGQAGFTADVTRNYQNWSFEKYGLAFSATDKTIDTQFTGCYLTLYY